MKKRVIALVTVVTILATSLVGCGAKEKDTWSSIQKEGKFTYACSGGYPPFNSIADDGSLTGFDVEIAQALGDVMGVEAVGITTEWDGILGGLTGKRFDCIIGSMAITEERLKEVSFTDPYYYDGSQFFSVASNNFSDISDANNSKVGVVTGTTFQEFLNENYPEIEVSQFQTDIENFMALSDGRTSGLVTSRFVGLQAPEEYGIVPVGGLLYTEDIGIAVRKEDEAFLKQLNDALATIIENGTYEEISNKYFGCNVLEK